MPEHFSFLHRLCKIHREKSISYRGADKESEPTLHNEPINFYALHLQSQLFRRDRDRIVGTRM
jgi:hypothetical protein